MEVVAKLVVSGNTLPAVAAAKSMVSQQVTDLEAGWAWSLLVVHLTAQSVPASHGEISGP